MSGYPIAHRINAGQNGYFARDWYTRQQISVGHNLGDVSKKTDKEVHDSDPTNHNYVSRFLNCHPNSEMNIHVGDTIIAYAPKREVLLGVGTVLGKPDYIANPRQLTDEDTHHYWRDITWRPWSKPVTLNELEKEDPRFVETGKDRAFPTSTLERYNGDLTGLKDAIEQTPRIDLNTL